MINVRLRKYNLIKDYFFSTKDSKAASMVFDGSGFVRYSVDMVYQLYPIKEMSFQYQTRQENGILLFFNDHLQVILQIFFISMSFINHAKLHCIWM